MTNVSHWLWCRCLHYRPIRLHKLCLEELDSSHDGMPHLEWLDGHLEIEQRLLIEDMSKDPRRSKRTDAQVQSWLMSLKKIRN